MTKKKVKPEEEPKIYNDYNSLDSKVIMSVGCLFCIPLAVILIMIGIEILSFGLFKTEPFLRTDYFHGLLGWSVVISWLYIWVGKFK